MTPVGRPSPSAPLASRLVEV